MPAQKLSFESITKGDVVVKHQEMSAAAKS